MNTAQMDYDSDPGRWASHDPAWMLDGDIHDDVATRIKAAGLRPVLDVGCGDGHLGRLLPDCWPLVGVDVSPAQLRRAQPGLLIQGHASRLPFAEATFGADAALWMLYHLADPASAIAEARRVLRPGGLLYACTSSRFNDPELIQEYPATSFDAEEADEIVATVFDPSLVTVVRWDAPLVRLADREEGSGARPAYRPMRVARCSRW
ncbi:MAG: class I SAM-dependent methyltransferase [Actinobacteria bacterium]|nr:class I SAM-dependent methyltransferase [Actinomycetota bacterium]